MKGFNLSLNKLKENRILFITFSVFYWLINILLFFAMIISAMHEQFFCDIDTAYYWINEIMLTIRSLTFIGCFTCIFMFYI